MSGRATGGDPAEAAARVRRLMAEDRLARQLGMELHAVPPAPLAVALTVGSEHLNFYGSCHGGVIFSLADTAFGLCCNAAGVIAWALGAHLTFSAAVQPGDVLTATATELTRTRRTGTYAVTVHNQAGVLVSHFMGTAYVTGKPADETPGAG